MNQTAELILPSANPNLNHETSQLLHLKAGEILARAGSPLKGLFTVKSGRIKRYRTFKNVHFLAGLVREGQSIGLDEILTTPHGERPISFERFEAVDDVTVLVQPWEAVESWLQSMPEGFLTTLREAARKVRHETFLRKPVDLLPVRARVAATLWILLEEYGHSDDGVRVLDLNLTRQEVAHLAGTVYESVIRTLTSLKKEGVIDLNGRVIRILKEDQLARIGQISIGEKHVQNTVSKDHSSPHDRSAKDAS